MHGGIELSVKINKVGDFILNSGSVDKEYSFRPAIQLKSTTQITKGDGTKTNTYTIN